ncbi:hypothetical protein Bca101_058340 [Brassica carinata]
MKHHSVGRSLSRFRACRFPWLCVPPRFKTYLESREPSKSLNASCAPSLLAEGTPAWVSQIVVPPSSRGYGTEAGLPCVTARGWPKSELRAPGASRHAVVNSSLVISPVVPVQKLDDPKSSTRPQSGEAPQRRTGPKFLERGAREGESPVVPDPVAPRGAVYESGCLGMQPQSGGKFRPRLNMGETDSEQVPRGKDEKDFEKRVKECLKLSGGKRMGPAMRPGRMRNGAIRPPIDSGVDRRGLRRWPKPGFCYARGDVAALIVVCSTRLTACLGICVLRASACGLPFDPP